MKKSILILIIISMSVIPAVSANTHTYVAGKPGINGFVINWTDNKNYSDIQSNIWDYTDTNGKTRTYYDIHAINKTGSNSTLGFFIDWHPMTKRPSEVNLMNFDFDESMDSAISSQSNIIIQGKNGLLLAFKEQKKYHGSDSPPDVFPPFFTANYFLDDHTEIRIRGNISDWSSKDFGSTISSLKIAPPAGYY